MRDVKPPGLGNDNKFPQSIDLTFSSSAGLAVNANQGKASFGSLGGSFSNIGIGLAILFYLHAKAANAKTSGEELFEKAGPLYECVRDQT